MKLLSIINIFSALIFNIYGHQGVDGNVEMTYVLQHNHPEREVENLGVKIKFVITQEEDQIPYRGSILNTC